MITIYTRADQAAVLARDLDPRLRSLLEHRFASLVTEYGDLTDWTELLVVEAGDTEEDIVREVGFSPLVDPDGVRFGTHGFERFWDHLAAYDGWFEFVVSFGSTFAYILLVEGAPDANPALLDFCKYYAGNADT